MGAGVSTEGAPLTRVKCKNNLGVLFLGEAEKAFYDAATGPEGEETVPWLEAAAYVKTRDDAKARDLLERALAIKERAYGRDHAELAITLTNLGEAVRRLGEPSKAVELLGRALSINEKAYGKDHVKAVFTLRDIGKAYCDLGDTAKARDFLQRAIPLFERANNNSGAVWCRNKLKSLT